LEFSAHVRKKEIIMAAPQSDTTRGKSKFALRPELGEAKERLYPEEKKQNGPNAEAQEAAREIEEEAGEREGADKPPDHPSANAIGPAGEFDGPETAGEEQDGFDGSLIERQKRRQDNIESFDDPHEREDLK
jgi:hypothetical protein